MSTVTYVARLVAIQTLVAIALIGNCYGQADKVDGKDTRANSDSELSIGQAERNPQADEWVTEGPIGPYEAFASSKAVSDCACGDDCKCFDEMICKAGDCKKNYLVFFTAKWCGPCKKMYGIINRLRDAGYIVYVIDVNDFPDAAKKANAHTLPTFIVMDNQKEVERFIGITSEDDLTKNLKKRDEQKDEPKPEPKPEPTNYDLG